MSKIIGIIKEEVVSFLNEEDYHGEHSAPHANSDDAPMHDLSGIYGEDIYGYDAARMYSHYGDSRDNIAIHVIQSAKDKPNQRVKIYRAVPDTNYETNVKLKELASIINYYHKYKFFPMKNKIVYAVEDKYDNLGYDDKIKAIYDDINAQYDELYANRAKALPINDGDWVTTDRNYAKEHGKSNLGKFKIVSKTVPARHLFTDGNDIFEWGYSIN